MADPLKFGLVGCGRAAERIHLPALSRSSTVQLVAVADTEPARAESIAKETRSCRVYPDAEEMVSRAELDALIIATPPDRHIEDLRLAAEAGLPALVEKPLASATDRLEPVGRIAEKVPVMVAYNRRYWAPVQALRGAILSGQDITGGRCVMHLSTDIAAWAPFSTRSDALDDLATHHLDLARFLFARRALTLSALWESAARLRVCLILEDEITVEITAAHEGRSVEQVEVTVAAEKYRVFMGSERVRPARGPIRAALDIGDAVRRRLAGRLYSLRLSYDRQLEHFESCVRGLAVPAPAIDEAAAVVRMMEAARLSAARNGIEIPLGE